jgi:hypothetical protein
MPKLPKAQITVKQTPNGPEQVYLCGGAGKLTPEAQKELEAFGEHLRRRTNKVPCDEGCKFSHPKE